MDTDLIDHIHSAAHDSPSVGPELGWVDSGVLFVVGPISVLLGVCIELDSLFDCWDWGLDGVSCVAGGKLGGAPPSAQPMILIVITLRVK